MGGMEFTWRIISTLAWPVVVIVVVLAFRRWISERLDSLGVTVGSLSLQLKTLDGKVNQVGQDISATLADNAPRPPVDEESIPESLVDLMALVSKNQAEGIRAAFNLVHQALKQSYPQLRRVLPSQLAQAMRGLVDDGEMEPDVALSVQQLYELMVMPEWDSDAAERTRGYAFLMLAEGAIHGILRSGRAGEAGDADDPGVARPIGTITSLDGPIGPIWRGTYNNSFPIELEIGAWVGDRFEGTLTYPDGGTVTSVTGSVSEEADGVLRLAWQEEKYVRSGSRTIDFKGSYTATITAGAAMEGAWYQAGRRVAPFTMRSVSGG